MKDNRDFMYYSKITNKIYSTKEELIKAEDEVLEKKKAAEEAALAKKKAEEQLKTQRAARAKEVEDAYAKVYAAEKEANDLLNKFVKDYGSFHMTLKDSNVPSTVPYLNDLFNIFTL